MTTITDTNDTAGHGHHSHDVPTVEHSTVFMADGHHEGTLVTLHRDKYVFVSLDGCETNIHERCVLVQLGTDKDTERAHDWWLAEVPDGATFGCDLDCPSGLLLVGCDDDDDFDSLGDVLWDSKEQCGE
jgi:hypothetical protein